jgi:hypothetical protein
MISKRNHPFFSWMPIRTRQLAYFTATWRPMIANASTPLVVPQMRPSDPGDRDVAELMCVSPT